MIPSFGTIIVLGLVALGILWCREMFGRVGRDLRDFRSAKNAGTKAAVVILWGVTAVIVVLLLMFLAGTLESFGVL